MATGDLECHYEGSDEASENELLERSLSVWRGWGVEPGEPDFSPIPLDLHTAASIGQYECVRNLISKEVDLERKNIGGWTALMYAAYIGHDNIVNLLLDEGVRVNVRNNKGQSPLMLAASCGNESVAYFLLQAQAELELRDKNGWTALFHATYSGHQNMVNFLLDNRAHAEALEPSRELTPFMMAAAAGHEIIVQCFLQHGVNVNAKALSGDTACSLALINGHTKIVSLIENHLHVHNHPLRTDPGFDADLSSSDENFQNPRRNPRARNRGPLNIKDGPEAFAKMLKAKHAPSNFRDITSPIGSHDDKESSSSNLDSSEGKESANDVEDETTAFSKTGALTIKSNSSSSGGLIAALGLSRENSVDGKGEVDQRSVCSDPGTSPFSQSWSTGQKPSKSIWQHTGGAGAGGVGGILPSPTPEQQQGLDILRGAEQLQTLEHIQAAQNRHADELTRQRIAEAFNLEAIPPYQPPPQNQPPPQQPPQNIVPPSLPMTTLRDYGKEKEMRPVAEVPAMHHPSMHQPHTVTFQDMKAKEVIEDDGSELASFLTELGLAKYVSVFQEQEVNLQVFLSLTDNDLKEVGIKLFGPRRKMTNAIARWHSGAGGARRDVEQAYADKLEAEMQELAIQLHQASEKCARVQEQLVQEQELRAVTEGYLLDDRAAWQHVQAIAADTRSRCSLLQHALHATGQYQEELRRRYGSDSPFSRSGGSGGSHGTDSLTAALKERLQLDDKAADKDLAKLPTQQLVRRMRKGHEELVALLGAVTANADRLLGQDVEYSGGGGTGVGAGEHGGYS